VSVVLPVFNAADTVAASADSVLAQSGVEVELVIVDDGSTDDTPRVLQRYAADPRVLVVRQHPNQGLVAALNCGLSAASNEFVARLDADDTALAGRLAHQVAVLADDPALVLTACAYERVLPSGEVLRRPRPPSSHGALAMAGWLGNEICHSAVMFRRSAVLATGGYRADRYPAEDFDLWMRLLQVGVFAGTDFVGTRYLVNPDGISQQHATAQRDMVQRIAALHSSALGLPTAAPTPAPATSLAARVRDLAGFRRRLRVHLRERGLPTGDVDRTAYRLAMSVLGDRPLLVRHTLTLRYAPGIWLARRGISRRAASDGPPAGRAIG
jgi:hypothetical protein